MSNDAINSWVDRAANNQQPQSTNSEIKVIKREVQSRGNIIMNVAEKIRPFLLKMFEGVRDENGILLQPAHIRGIALNMAQGIVKEQESNN
ncbi:MAG: hypothetical protein R3D71_04010 [Rickettsiales bacterium]